MYFNSVFQVAAIEKYFKEQVGHDLPEKIEEELKALKKRINNM